MNPSANVTYTVFDTAKKFHGREYTTSWQEMASFISKHKPYASKHDAKLVQLSSTKIAHKISKEGKPYTTNRGYEALNSVTAIGLDVDNDPDKPYLSWDDVRAILKQLNLAYVMYTSFSHTSEHHKLRIVIPLSRPILQHEKDLYDAIWKTLCVRFSDNLDYACRDMARIFYIASRSTDATAYRSETDLTGNAIDVAKFEQLAEDLRFDREEAERQRKLKPISSKSSSIEEFNQLTDICDLLERYGYLRSGDGRYLSPESLSGSAGVTIGDNVCFIRHENDKLMKAVAAKADRLDWPIPFQGSRYGYTAITPFDVIQHLECGGDFAKALRHIKGEVSKWNH